MGRDVMEGGDGKMFSNPPLPDNSFSTQNAPKRLTAGLRPDPLGELKRTSKSLSRSGGHGREHSALMYFIMFAQYIIQRQYLRCFYSLHLHRCYSTLVQTVVNEMYSYLVSTYWEGNVSSHST
jgi:hypothetical protein